MKHKHKVKLVYLTLAGVRFRKEANGYYLRNAWSYTLPDWPAHRCSAWYSSQEFAIENAWFCMNGSREFVAAATKFAQVSDE